MEKVGLDYGQLMTGAVVTGVQNAPNAPANIEVEKGEYIKFPDGSVAKALGERHEKGGIKLIAPDMTEILSNTKDLTISKSLVKKLKKDYEMNNVSENDTYSKVLDKYARKIGYSKLLEKEADLFNAVKKNTEKALSEGSLNINNNYLASKIYELQQEKAPLQAEFTKIFDVLFEEQQKSKPEEERVIEPIQNTELEQTASELSQEQVFRLGGKYNEVKSLATKYNIPITKAYEMLEQKGLLLPKFDNGGIVYNLRTNRNDYKGINYTESQSANKAQYGSIQSAEESLTQLFRNFPTILSDDYYKKYIDIENGRVKVKEGVKLNTVNEDFIGKLQRDMNNLMSNSAKFILEDKTGKFTEQAKKQAQEYVDKELFNEQGIRGYDAKLGDFTSGRFSLGIDLVTPEDLKKLRENNIYTVRQLQANPELLDSLSEASKKRINQFLIEAPEGSDFTIERFSQPVNANTPEPVEVEQTNFEPYDSTPIQIPVQANRNRLFQMPDQRYLPPMSLQAESLYETDLGRIDPVRLGIEDTIRRNQDNTQFLASQVQNLPPTVASGILASAIAQSQTSENQAINQIHQLNAQNASQAEQFNIRQADTEQISNNQARLNYEQRALLGLSKTDQDIRNWYNANRAVNINNFREQQIMNTMANMFPQYGLDFSGTNVVFNPKTQQMYMPVNREFIQAMQVQQMPTSTGTKTKSNSTKKD